MMRLLRARVKTLCGTAVDRTGGLGYNRCGVTPGFGEKILGLEVAYNDGQGCVGRGAAVLPKD
jgi:hypothetical protein